MIFELIGAIIVGGLSVLLSPLPETSIKTIVSLPDLTTIGGSIGYFDRFISISGPLKAIGWIASFIGIMLTIKLALWIWKMIPLT